jgi:parallel beta-helix repeat protein
MQITTFVRLMTGTFLVSVLMLPAPTRAQSSGKASISVGIDQGELRGNTHRVLQAAVDHVATLGGGTVRIGPGEYQMRNALTLRDGVSVIGEPGRTVLVACDGRESLLAADGDCNERQITLQDPSGFKVGDGVSIQDQRKGGFEVTTATLTEQLDDRTFRISAPLYLDYMMAEKASARLVFPVVGGWQVRHVTLEGLTIEGNRDRTQPLNGCRGGGIFLFECEDVTIRNCTIRNYNGDGVSFQVSQRVTVEHCRAENNAGLGLHPGSGSQHPVLRYNISERNGGDGLFVCWRVKHGLFEENQLLDNRGVGISIGHKDSDNLFRKNTVKANSRAGVLFRNETEPMGAHRNVFEKNIILDNGLSADGKVISESIVIKGVHRDLQFRENTIGFTRPVSSDRAAISASAGATGLRLENNTLQHLSREVDAQK